MRFETKSSLGSMSLEMCKMTGRETKDILGFVEAISWRETEKVKGRWESEGNKSLYFRL